MRIVAVDTVELYLVLKCERVRFSPLAMVFSARRFAPRSLSPHRTKDVVGERPGYLADNVAGDTHAAEGEVVELLKEGERVPHTKD